MQVIVAPNAIIAFSHSDNTNSLYLSSGNEPILIQGSPENIIARINSIRVPTTVSPITGIQAL